ncbi:HIT domain-containing protein [Telmatospirillum sp. J64-1]|uniref:HIT domain-containing protein n=1 Tax=Telmatospirillum sp. J64-1 TaxID=2502183 RepID=UPI00115CDF02|nr:HIT family protein [Telmatospirillum sp. J64-1]
MFQLDERLAADTVEVARWHLCRILLMNESTYPWLILVPQREGVTEIHHLDVSDQGQLMAEIARASKVIEAVSQPDKVNVAALGNVVPQLHVHVVGRFRSDPAWPGAVWGRSDRKPYEPEAMEAMVNRLQYAIFNPLGE